MALHLLVAWLSFIYTFDGICVFLSHIPYTCASSCTGLVPKSYFLSEFAPFLPKPAAMFVSNIVKKIINITTKFVRKRWLYV